MASVNSDSNNQSTHSLPTPIATNVTATAKNDDTRQSLDSAQLRTEIQGPPALNSPEIVSSRLSVSSQKQTAAVWQCSHSLLSEGMKTTIPQPKGLLGTHISDIGPLVLLRDAVAMTTPYVSNLKEMSMKRHLDDTVGMAESSSLSSLTQQQQQQQQQRQRQYLQLIKFQRQLRANFVTENYDEAVREMFVEDKDKTQGAASLLSRLLPLNTYFRRKRQNKRESKTLEKNWKEKQGNRDSTKRRNNMAFSKAALGHRDEFLRFHKAKRTECARLGRAVRQQLESAETKKEKQEGKAEARRLQALKENDMESYMKLVQETKNTRLKHLLDQTDDYISTINRMVQAQRMEAETTPPEGAEEGKGETVSLVCAVSGRSSI